MKRRGYLSTVSLTAASISSGCASILDSPTVQLGGVIAANYTDEPLEIEISVREDGTIQQHATVNLPPASESERNFTRELLECTWPKEARNFVVESEMEDDDSTMDLAAETDDKTSACFVVGVSVGITPGLTTTATPCKDASTELTCDFIDE